MLEANKLALLVPERYDSGHLAKKLYALFFAMTALVLIVAGGVAAAVATRVSQPIKTLVDDVRSIPTATWPTGSVPRRR